MSIFKDIQRDLTDLLTQRAFDVDISDPDVPLETKMGDAPHIFAIGGPNYIHMGVVRQRGGSLVLVDEYKFEDDALVDRDKLLDGALKSPKWQEMMSRFKKGKRRFLLGYMPDKGDGIFLSERTQIPVVDTKAKGKAVPKQLAPPSGEGDGDAPAALSLDERTAWLNYWLRENPIALMESIGQEMGPGLRYGVLPIKDLNGHFLFPQDADEVDAFIKRFYPLGDIIKVSLVPLSILSCALEYENLHREAQREIGLMFVGVNGTLLAYGWNKAAGAKPILRVVGLQKGGMAKSAPKESQLGRTIGQVIKTWMTNCKIRSDSLGDGLSFLHYEQEDIADHELAKVIQDVLPNQGKAIKAEQFINTMDRIKRAKDNDPISIDIATIAID
jgi:hypothetical protein